MQDFINYLEKENIIKHLKQFYKVSAENHDSDIFFKKMFESLVLFNDDKKSIKRPISSDFDEKNFDIFSNLYEKSRNHKEKKRLGEFYTPISIVNYILDALDYNSLNRIETKNLIDISCGSGSFIIQAIIRLIKRCLKIHKQEKISDLTIGKVKRVISKIKDNIYGIDINPIACILCQINIHYVLFELFHPILSSEPKYTIPWFNIKNCNALIINIEEKYDYVVGNPPYLFIRDIPLGQRSIIESSKFKTNNGQYDYYQIFLELGIKILKKRGMLGYIVPDSLLALSNRSILRKYIYDNTKIKQIYHTGPKFRDPIVSNIILILQKENEILERKNNVIKLKFSNQQENTIQQNTIENWNYKFLIHLNNMDIFILEHLFTKFPKFKDLSKKYNIDLVLGRGVELTKTGKIIFCEKCKKYLPIPHNILKCHRCQSDLSEENSENIIYEVIPPNAIRDNFQLFLYSIKRYQKTQYKYIDTSKVGINYKDIDLYEDRIIIRQLSQNKKICATYDKKLSLTSQSFYNLKIKYSPIPEFTHYYLLGLFNSMLFSYFFIKSFGTYKKLFPRILLEKIKGFPIKVPISDTEKEKSRKIIENVKRILDNFEKLAFCQERIDILVFDLYQISEINQKYILNYMKTLNG
jgi:hypothetical protein